MRRQVACVALWMAAAFSAAAAVTDSPATPSKAIVRMTGARYELLLNRSPCTLKGAFATQRIAELAAELDGEGNEPGTPGDRRSRTRA